MIQIFKQLFARKPDFTIGRVDDVYMRRWYIIPRNRFFNIYLHNTLRDDDDVGLHDHPWWNISIVLKGGYWECMPRVPYPQYTVMDQFTWAMTQVEPMMLDASQAHYAATQFMPPHRRVWRGPGAIVFRRAVEAHRLELDIEQVRKGQTTLPKSIPSWSLFITGPNKRTWGFWCKDGWRPHTMSIRKTDTGNEVGAGCGEVS